MIIIVEPEHSGHHFNLHLRIILAEFRKCAQDFCLVTRSRALKSKEFHKLDSEYALSDKCVLLSSFYENLLVRFSHSKVITSLIYYFAFFEIAYRLNFNANTKVYLINLDHIDRFLCFGSPFRRARFSSLYMQTNFLRNYVLESKKDLKSLYSYWSFIRFIRSPFLNNIFLYDSEIKSNDIILSEDRKLIVIPDLGSVNKREVLNYGSLFGLQKGIDYILVYGSIDRRKNLIYLSKLLEFSNLESFGIIVAGKIKDSVLRDVQEIANKLNSQRFVVVNTFIDDELEELVFNFTRFVWVCYDKKFIGSSGVLYQAASVAKPVIGSNHGVISAVIKKEQIGLTLDGEDIFRDSLKFRSLVSDKDVYREMSENCIRFSKKNKQFNFPQAIIKSYD